MNADATGNGGADQMQALQALVEELEERIRQLELNAAHQQTHWGQRVFIAQPDSGGSLLSESWASYTGTNPTTVALSDLGTLCRSFPTNRLIIPPSGAMGVMEFAVGTSRAYAKIPGGVDLLNQGTNVISATPFINIPTNRGTANIFSFATATISGTPGANFVFNAGSSNNVGIYWHASSGTWVIDYAKFHT